MKKVFSRLYNQIFKEATQFKKTTMQTQALVSRKDLNIWKALHNKQRRDFVLDKPLPVLQQNRAVYAENLLLENSSKRDCDYVTVEKFFVDKKGFIHEKIISSEAMKQVIKECIEQKIAPYGSIIKILTENKPFAVLGKSGIYAPPPTLFDDITMPFKLCVLMSKFVITFLGQDVFLNEKTMLSKLEQFFNISENLEDMHNFYPIAQHIVNSIMANIKFCPTLLYGITGTHVDYTFYMDKLADVSKIIESFVTKKTLLPFLQEKAGVLYTVAQNPDNPLSDHAKYASQAYKLMKQPHPDFRIENSLTAKIMFYDVKLRADAIKNIPTLKGVLTLVPSFSEEKKILYIKKTRADLGNVSKIANNIGSSEQLDISQHIFTIKKLESDKNISIEQKYILFQRIQNEIDLNPNIMLAVCSRVVKTELDVYFFKIWSENPEIKNQLEKMGCKIDVQALMPPQGQGHQIAQVGHWKELCLKVVLVMPEHLKPVIYKNLLKFLSLEQ